MNKIFKTFALLISISILLNNPVFADTQLSGERIKDDSINLNTKVYGILPILNGGTGSSTFDAYTSSDFSIDFLTKTTDDLEVGIHNFFYTNSLSLGTTLTGLSLASSSDITSSDTMLSAFGKLQAQIDSIGGSAVSSVFGRTGVVTAQSGDYTTAIVADSTDKRYVTDAQQTVIGNTSGTNTGDNATNSQYSGLAASKQDALVSGTNIKTVNSTSLLGSGNIDTTQSSVTGNAGSSTAAAITDDTTTNATMFPTWVTANTGNLPVKVSSTKVTFNPSTGMFTATGFTGSFTGNVTGNVSGNAGTVTDGAYLTASNAFTKQNTLTQQTLTSSSNHIAWNANNGNSAVHTATENTTLDNPTNLVAGTIYTFQFTQHASSAKTLAFGNKWKFVGGTPTITTTLSGVQIIQGIYDGTNINCGAPIGPFS